MVPFSARVSAGVHPIDLRSRVSPASRVVPIRRVDDLAVIKSSESVREDTLCRGFRAIVEAIVCAFHRVINDVK